ncbi:MAG TPA: amidohydrolase family protein [Ilumatobacteraceae bacterium]|nr:amidohydrolase family protein [Ilumatobacteraceae bacterium]HRB01819.1 amidohydrolase family protein [Ilumatobacteraceae bacterium]
MSIVAGRWAILEPGSEPVRDAAVRLDGGIIAEVGGRAELVARHPQLPVVDGDLLLPGFVNAHTHTYGVLAHGIPQAAAVTDFWSFLTDYWWPRVEDALDQEMIATATEWAVAEMLRTGTTTFYDILEAPRSLPAALAAQADVVERMGARGILSFEATERAGAEVARLGLAENVTMVGRGRTGAAGLVTGAMCFHTTFTCSERYIREAFALADDLGVFCHAHVNEGTYEAETALARHGLRTIELYADWGVLSDRFLASQCVQLSGKERELLAQHDVRVSHMPLANCEVGGGIAPMPELLAAGVTVGLGSDGYLNDMFQVMRGAFLIHKGRLCDPQVMPARTVVSMATTGGARALGLDGTVGRLAVGFAADLQLVDLSLPTAPTAHNLYEQLVLWRSGTDVTDVMVAGSWRVRKRELLGVDLARLRARVQEQAERLWTTA